MEAGVATSSAASAADPWLFSVGGGATGGWGALVLPLLWHGVTFFLGQYAADKSLQGIESLLSDYSQTVKSLQASEKLEPGATRLGSIVGAGPRAIVSGVKLAQTAIDAAGNAGRTALAAGADPAAANAARLRAAAGAVLPPVAASSGAGAAFELTVRPAVDGLLHQAADVLHIDHDPFQSPTLRSVLTSAVLGGLMSGENSPGRTGENPGQTSNSAQVSDIFGRWLQAKQQGVPIEQALNPSEIGLLQNAAPRITAALQARAKAIAQDPAAFQESARQGLSKAGNTAGSKPLASRQGWPLDTLPQPAQSPGEAETSPGSGEATHPPSPSPATEPSPPGQSRPAASSDLPSGAGWGQLGREHLGQQVETRDGLRGTLVDVGQRKVAIKDANGQAYAPLLGDARVVPTKSSDQPASSVAGTDRSANAINAATPQPAAGASAPTPDPSPPPIRAATRPSKRRNDPDGVIRNAQNGVDFSSSPDLYPVTGNQKNIVRINYTGYRRYDFRIANKLAGFTKTPKDYSWHHLDDYNPLDNTGSLQLVKRDTHEMTYKHAGGVKQWEQATGRKYDDYSKKNP